MTRLKMTVHTVIFLLIINCILLNICYNFTEMECFFYQLAKFSCVVSRSREIFIETFTVKVEIFTDSESFNLKLRHENSARESLNCEKIL